MDPTSCKEDKEEEEEVDVFEVISADKAPTEPAATNPPDLSTSPTTKPIIENTKDVLQITESEETEEAHFFNSLVDHKELTHIIWGDEIKQDNFERWSQGFIFDSKKEATALLQYNGGPCAVITAVQAFLLRELIFCANCGKNWRTPDGCYFLLFKNQ